MAGTSDQDTVIVRLMENGYIRSHLKEVENLQMTSGTYYTLYGDNKKLDERTEKRIDLQKSKLLKEYSNLTIFVFNTAPFNFNIDFECDSSDFLRIKGRIKCTASLRNNKISLAEKVDFRTVAERNKVFCRSDVVRNVSDDVRDEVVSVTRVQDAKSISDNADIIKKNCHVPDSVRKWMSSYGFSIMINEVFILSNGYDERVREGLKEQREAERREKDAERAKYYNEMQKQQLENEQLRSQLNILKAKNQLDEKTGETKDTVAFKRLHANNLAHGIFDGNGEFYESEEYIVCPRSKGVLISRMKDLRPHMTIPHRISKEGRTFEITDVGPNVFRDDPGIVTEVTIDHGIVNIEGSAFQNCTSLVSVTLPNTLRTIAANAFINCPRLKTLEIPDGVDHIDDDAFNGCLLSEIVVPEGLDISNLKLPRTTAVKRG